jgi:uncharacterized protein (UPF0261 family)
VGKGVVAVIGTLDTKGEETYFLKYCLEVFGQGSIVIDTGIVGEPRERPEVTREQVARASGTSVEELRAMGDRDRAIELMGRGAASVLAELRGTGRLSGAIGLGGSAGIRIAARAMQALPFGFPKLIVTTMAAGYIRPYVGVQDIMLLNPVVEIRGLNRFLEQALANAAAALAGMVGRDEVKRNGSDRHRPVIAATVIGATAPCVAAARKYLEGKGCEVVLFHATGTGGQAMEALASGGLIDGVLDVTTSEWADQLLGGRLAAGSTRLEGAGKRGIPQVVAPGGLDVANFGGRETLPERMRGRRLIEAGPHVTLVRTSPEENGELGRVVAEKLNGAAGPVEIFVPMGGFSTFDKPEQPFHDADAAAAFRRSLRSSISRGIRVHERPEHINDEAFGLAVAERLYELVQEHRGETQRQPSAG